MCPSPALQLHRPLWKKPNKLFIRVPLLGLTGGGTLLFYPLIQYFSYEEFLPVSVRRLQDTGKSGWFILVGLIPLVGALILIYFYAQDSQPGENQYGANPKDHPTQY